MPNSGDYNLFDLLVQTADERDRPRIYGKNLVDIKQLALDNRDWETIAYVCQGFIAQAPYSTFLAPCKITGGAVHVVLF